MKKVSLFLVCSMLLCSSLAGSAQCLADGGNTGDGTISTYAAIIEWRYKIINGKFYKRQFNHSTADWVGPWILVK